MASAEKFPAGAVKNILAHNDRETAHPRNKDIDSSRSHLNYSLINHGMTAYDYFWARRQEVHCHHRADMKPLVGWVLTQPTDLDASQEEAFFRESHNFVANRYGERNIVQSVVHRDESGQNHIHINFLPVVYDKNKGYEKIAANTVLSRTDLCSFHRDWQRHLDAHGIACSVYTGVTKANGGNKTVAQLKRERDMQLEPQPIVHQHEEVQRDRWAVAPHETLTIEQGERGRW